jgi:hydrophobic/amphiphilic exporter-1 (mainly G- bacteria), HAE1 family
LSAITKLLTSKRIINIIAPDYKVSRNVLEKIISKIKPSGMILSFNPVVNKEKPEVKIKFDKDKLKSFGLTIKEAALQIRALSNGENGGRLYEKNKYKDIIVRLKKNDRNNISHMSEFPIMINRKIVKVKSFAVPEIKIGYTKFLRKNQKQSYPVECRVIKGDFNKFKKILNKMKFNSNVNIEIPEEEEMKSSIDSLIYSIILSVLLIYMILASQFESFKKPLFILLSVPLTIPGISFSLLITNTSINIISGLGMVMLSGIVVNNAIVLIEYIKNEIDSNNDLKDAIISGAAKRLKPILMTSLTTIFALIPMAINIDSGNQASLAITVIGGLFFSTILILVLIPIFYYKIESN